MPGLYSHTTRATGTVLTATIYNSDHQNHIDNLIPSMIDDQSTNAAAMQATTSPGGVGTESLATSLQGELERLRYVIKTMHGGAQWYPGVVLAPVVTLTAGLGLSGGGDTSANRTFTFDPTELTLVTIASGDKLVLQDVSDSGNPKTGLASDIISIVTGREVQKVRTELTSTLSAQGGTGGTYNAATGLSATITPASGNNVRIRGFINLTAAASGCNAGIRIKRDSTVLLVGAAASSRTPVLATAGLTTTQFACIPFDILDLAPGTSAFVYSVEVVIDQNQTWNLNRTNTDSDAATSFRAASVIEAIEIKA